MDLRRADLHLHTTCSDGTLDPEALVRKALRHGLRAVAVTDHDAVDGVAAARATGAKLGVDVVAGVELSVTATHDGESRELHLLGYFFDPAHAGLAEHLATFRRARTERAAGMVERLRALGVPVTMEAVLEAAGDGAVGRPHVAAALVAGGHVASYGEAFSRYLADGAPAWVAKPLFPARDALRLLHDAGGIGVLAHPGHWTSDRLVRALAEDGMDGLEVVHPSHDANLTRYWREVADALGLLRTGGSDYHGHRPYDEGNLGRYSIPYPHVDRLRHAPRRAA